MRVFEFIVPMVAGFLGAALIIISTKETVKIAHLKAENEHMREYCGDVEQKADRVLKMIEGGQ